MGQCDDEGKGIWSWSSTQTQIHASTVASTMLKFDLLV